MTASMPPKHPFPLLGRAWRPTFLLVLAAAAACQSDSGSAPDPFTGDPWTLSGPELKHRRGGRPGMYIFGPVTGPRSRSRWVPLYSLHRREGSIRRWSADGTPSGSGREERARAPASFGAPGTWGSSATRCGSGMGTAIRSATSTWRDEYLGRVSPEVDFGDFRGPEGVSAPPGKTPSGRHVRRNREPTPADWSSSTGEMTEAAFTHTWTRKAQVLNDHLDATRMSPATVSPSSREGRRRDLWHHKPSATASPIRSPTMDCW